MLNSRKPTLPKLTLGGPGGLGRVHVDIEAFFDFSFWLAEELEDLVRLSTQHQARPYPPLYERLRQDVSPRR